MRPAAALIFNSGYDANFGLLSCIAQKGDLILYDKLSHASIRDGIRQSFADSFSFVHNDLVTWKKIEKPKRKLFCGHRICFFDGWRYGAAKRNGRSCAKNIDAHLIVDEAHATGVIGERGEGRCRFGIAAIDCFARIHTFGKALGCHGAVILGSHTLRNYLINFCRPFIYSTAIPPAIRRCYTSFL